MYRIHLGRFVGLVVSSRQGDKKPDTLSDGMAYFDSPLEIFSERVGG